MGYMRAHSILVTSWSPEKVASAHMQAQESFKGIAPVSGIILSPVNGYRSFFVGPDGSKEGWDASNAGDKARDLFIAWLDVQRYEDGSSALKWAEVQYGDEEGETKIVRHSEQGYLTP